MTTPERRADAASRLRKAHASLVAAKALFALQPPCRDDAVNLRTLVEDGLEADSGEAPAYDDDERSPAVVRSRNP